MRIHRSLTLLIALTLTAAATHAQHCTTTAADQAAVADTLRTFYAAATVDDLPKLHSVVAPTFYAYDGGIEYTSIDTLMQAVKSYQDQGAKFVWNVTNPKVTLGCNDAWITYLNNGSVQMPNAPTPTPTQWLESAVLQKSQNTWKLLFFHSTRVPASTPKS